MEPLGQETEALGKNVRLSVLWFQSEAHSGIHSKDTWKAP